jgi:hypothetical protein
MSAMGSGVPHRAAPAATLPGVDSAAATKAGFTCIPTVPRDFRWAVALVVLFVAALGADWIARQLLRAVPPARPPPRSLLLDLCVSRT